MHGKLLFIIPIYFRSLEKHGNEYEKKYTEFLIMKKRQYSEEYENMFKENRLKFDLEFQNYWYPWQYTQIIKIIEIRYVNRMLKAYIYSVEAKRYRPIMNKKIFKYIGKIRDVSILNSYSDNQTIKSDIINFIEEIKTRYNKYYVDSEMIENIIPLIDFKVLNKNK